MKILGQYATLGQYDFINIFEAPDENTIYKVAVKFSGKGVMLTITLGAKDVEFYHNREINT